MPHTGFIGKLFDLKDQNIYFSENCYEEVRINNIIHKVIKAKFNYEPTACYNCGHIHDQMIIKHVTKESTISDDRPDHKPDEDDVLVFYTFYEKSYSELISKLHGTNSEVVKAKNPYWDSNGRTYLDPDGFRVVICHRDWRYDT